MDFQNQQNKIRQMIKKGDSAALWEAVNIEKRNPSNGIPEEVFAQTVHKFSREEWPQAFADFLQNRLRILKIIY
jgi:hypothetical protein